MNQTRQAWQACGWELGELDRRHHSALVAPGETDLNDVSEANAQDGKEWRDLC